jgi:peptidyl-prolyl cis-trans isomerase SurA
MKNVALIISLLFASQTFFGQTLARYGNHQISREEFLIAYRKNNTNTKATEQSYRDYLELYIRYRLKVQAAYDKKLDTLPGQITELQNFRSQITDQYSNDESSLDRLTEEVFVRSQKDVRLSYILVANPRNFTPADTLRAWQKINAAYAQLKKNKTFEETADAFSEDPFVKTNHGDLGFVTVFGLPYALETLAYQLRVGQISPVFKIAGAYLILKKTGERPAAGRMRMAQILLIFPYQADEAAKADTKRRADSLYQAIQAGADFADLARKFSGDNLTYQLGGVLPEFGVGKYDPVFEKAAFDLKKDGAISEPFVSNFGYHILKRIAHVDISDTRDKKTMEDWKGRVKADPRIEVSKKEMLQTILKATAFKQVTASGAPLFALTDSILQGKKPPVYPGLNERTILYRIGDNPFTVKDWINYRRSLNRTPAMINGKTNRELLEQYRQTLAFEYYKTHLEKYNKSFAGQLTEFRDGNLLFEVMQRQVWDKASADTTGLKNYFEAHVRHYWWQSSADAIIFNAGNEIAAEKIRQHLQNGIVDWRRFVDSLGGQVQADSGRFELSQLPSNGMAEEQHFTSVVPNPDKTVQFAYVIRKFPDSEARTFDDARGMVINDYQNELENRWITELKKKYPVKVNEEVFKTLPQ